MAACLVVCHECGKGLYGSEPAKIEYRMVMLSGRIRPICEPCYEDRRRS